MNQQAADRPSRRILPLLLPLILLILLIPLMWETGRWWQGGSAIAAWMAMSLLLLREFRRLDRGEDRP